MKVSTVNDGAIIFQGSCRTKRKAIRAIIFDLDGTLLDTESLSCRAVIESFATTGFIIPEEILATLGEGGLLLPWELKRRILGLRGSGMCMYVSLCCLMCVLNCLRHHLMTKIILMMIHDG